MAEVDDSAPWLTLREAAERSGKQLDAMRALARRGRLPRRKGNRGEWLVQLPEAMSQGVQGNGLDTASDDALGADLDTSAELAKLRDQVTELRVSLARAEAKVEAVTALARNE